MNNSAIRSIILLVVLLCAQTLLLGKQEIPIAPVYPDTTNILGVKLIDQWSWLKNRDHRDLPNVLQSEAKYTKSHFRQSSKLSRKIYKEFVRNLDDVFQSHPYPLDGYYYYSRQTKSQSYACHFRFAEGQKGKAKIVLDENKLARGRDFFQLDAFEVSPNTQMLAYSVDITGSEQYSLFIKDLRTGETEATPIHNLSQAIWLSDNRTLLITTVNSRFQTDILGLYDIASGTLSTLYMETNPAYDLSIYSNISRELVFVQSSSKNTSQTWYLDATASDPILTQLFERKENVHISVDYLNGLFYVATDLEHPDYSILVYDPKAESEDAWETLVSGRDREPISSFTVMDGYLVLLRRNGGFERIEVYDAVTGLLLRSITNPNPVDFSFWVNSDPHSSDLFYSMENELLPYRIIRHNLKTGIEDIEYLKLPKHDIGFDQYKTEIQWVIASDGERIPLRLIYRKDIDITKPSPLWLYAYGAYGDCEDPYYSSTMFSLLDRGFIYAVAHIRGGGELGKSWYENGRGIHKKNTFTDFQACIDYLLENSLTASRMLVIEGGSAGGLVIGAALNMVPEKVGVAIADVPFVDLINSMLDDDLPLTQQEYEEWGSPYDETFFRYMLSYSPYDNVILARYPKVLINTAWNDIRVGYWEGLKLAQNLRTHNLSDNPILFRMLLNEGHTGTNDRFQSLKNYAELMAWAIHSLVYK